MGLKNNTTINWNINTTVEDKVGYELGELTFDSAGRGSS
jgi:hypothetical protein